MSRTIERMQTLKDDEALELLVKMVSYFNDEQGKLLQEFINSLSEREVIEFLSEVKTSGMNIHIPPLLWGDAIYEKLRTIYRENDWIEPYTVYIKQDGRYVEMLNKLYTGSMYIIKLKQSAKKGLSVRSTGHVSHRGLPEKTKRSHKELYSKTPIRFGGDENNNMNIGVNSKYINALHMFHRSSVNGRQSLAELLTQFMTKPDKMDGSYGSITIDELVENNSAITNRNIEIMNAYNKILCLKLVQENPASEMMLIDRNNRGELHELKDGTFIVGSEEDKIKGNLRIDVIKRLQKTTKDIEWMSSEEYNKFIDETVNKVYNNI